MPPANMYGQEDKHNIPGNITVDKPKDRIFLPISSESTITPPGLLNATCVIGSLVSSIKVAKRRASPSLICPLIKSKFPMSSARMKEKSSRLGMSFGTGTAGVPSSCRYSGSLFLESYCLIWLPGEIGPAGMLALSLLAEGQTKSMSVSNRRTAKTACSLKAHHIPLEAVT